MLHLAAANNHEDIVLYILDHLKSVKAPEAINCQNEEGNTPLHWAAVNGNTNIVEILIRSGANPDVCLQFQILLLILILKYFR